MRPLVTLVAVAAAIVLALAVVWFVSPRATSSAAPAPSADAPRPDSRAEDRLPEAEDDSAAAGTAAETTRSAIEELGSTPAPARITPATARGGVRLTGEVRDAAGNPVAGAKVLAAQGPEATFGGLPLDIARGPFASDRGRLESTTGGDGRFELDGGRAGRLRLAVRKPGYAPLDRDEVDVPAVESFDLGVVAIEASAVVEGRVIDSLGRPVAGARVERVVDPPHGAVIVFDGFRTPSVELAVTGPDGRFAADQLAAGPYSLRVTTEDHPDETIFGSTERPGERVSVTIELEDGFEISGRVVGAPAGEIAKLAVRAAPTDDEPGSAETGGFDFDIASGGGETREAKLAADASFTVRGLREAMNYGLSLRRRGEGEDPFLGSVSARTVAAAGTSGIEIAYQPESALVLAVVDARTGAPVEEFEIEAGIAWRMPLRAERGASPRTHPGGTVRFPGLRAKSKDDRASLEIRATGYRDHEVEGIALTPGADTDLGVIALEPVPVTRVTVVDAATGKPVAAARVTLRELRDEPADVRGFRAAIDIEDDGGGDPHESVDFGSDDMRTARSDAQGVAVLTSFEGARCRVDVSHGDYASFRSESFVAPSGAPHEVTARMQRGGAVRVKLLDADGAPVVAGRIEHRAAGDANEFAPFPSARPDVTDTEGIAVFGHLAAGSHRFRPAGAGDGGFTGIGGAAIVRFAGEERDQGAPWTEVEVEEGGTSEITLVAPVRVSLTGVVREGGSPLAGATVRLKARAKDEGERPALADLFGGGPQARTDGSGAYAIDGVGAGDYTLVISHPTRQMPHEQAVAIGDVDRRVDVELSIATIEGVVEDADGKPVAGARVSVERARSETGPTSRRVVSVVMASADGGMVSMFGDDAGAEPVLTDAEGRYLLRGVLDGVELVVSAEAEGLEKAQSERLRVAANQARTGVDLVLRKAGRIDVSVFARDGSPARMVLVTARRADGTGDVLTEFVGEGGKKTLDGLGAGSWRVSVRRAGPDDGTPAPPEQVVEVAPGEATPVRFDLP